VLESVEEPLAPPGTRVRAILANIPLHAYGCLHLPLPPKQAHRVKKVLLVDDESNMRFVLRMTLEAGGYEVLVAQHGAAALETLRRSGADLVLTDLMMPVMSGRELVERLRADPETAEIPIVVVTATHEPVLPEADAVITKPFHEEELLAVVRSLTGKEQA
jgi:CheY-like chemotaxis protein